MIVNLPLRKCRGWNCQARKPKRRCVNEEDMRFERSRCSGRSYVEAKPSDFLVWLR